MVIEGYDLVAFGAAIPNLLRSEYLGITALSATAIAVLSLVGVGLGAAAVGPRTNWMSSYSTSEKIQHSGLMSPISTRSE